jgi:UDP-N-acetylmuramoyl-L-alanyl-D-glutamate--2,6-diaminopimelate ligase
LAEGTTIEMEPAAALQTLEIRGLSADSRKIAPGDLFAAIPGGRADGRDFIGQAIERGAVAVLTTPGTSLGRHGRPVALVTDQNPRRRLALIAARFFGRQPAVIAAVTGTNGKTSVVEFARQIWSRLGHNAASLGTLGVMPPRLDAPASLTTPDPVELHRCLAALARDGVEHLAMEASSHGLDQYRLEGVEIRAAAFTNLSRDHLDYHGGAEAYLAAKLRLFTELVPPGGGAVLNADVPEFETLRAAALARGLKILTYGAGGGDLCLVRTAAAAEGQCLTLKLLGRRHDIALPLPGRFQAANVLAALGLVIATGTDPEAALEALPQLGGVAGRLELVARAPSGGQVYVDYAHTPDALRSALEALRRHASGRLCVVFGCGGDRDRGKRPLMGEIARSLADQVIVTDDNPRSEDPAAIRRAILAAAPGALEIGDRAEAIETAVAALGPGDLLVVAGKGHEPGQIVGDRVLPFDDRDMVRDVVARLEEGRP